MVFVEIQLKLSGYSNDHDGYCSGNECVYQEFNNDPESKLYEFVPQDFREFIDDCEDFPCVNDDTARKWFSDWLDELTHENYRPGSVYCENSSTSFEKHTCDIQVHDIEVVSISM
jgi:hypothetical protein